jgi:hypothetical protein
VLLGSQLGKPQLVVARDAFHPLPDADVDDTPGIGPSVDEVTSAVEVYIIPETSSDLGDQGFEDIGLTVDITKNCYWT